MRNLLIAAAAAVVLTPAIALAQPAGPRLVGAVRAVETVERAMNGRVVDLELDRKNGRLVYEMEVVKGGKLHYAHVDAMDGKLVRSGQEITWRNFLRRDWMTELEKTQPLSRLLVQTTRDGAQVTEVDLERDHGGLFYHVDLVKDGIEREVRLDARTGAMTTALVDD